MFRIYLFTGFLVIGSGQPVPSAALPLDDDPCVTLSQRAAMDHVLEKSNRLIKTYHIRAGDQNDWIIEVLTTAADSKMPNVEIWKEMTEIWKKAHPLATKDQERSFIHKEKHVLQKMALGLDKYWQCRKLDSRKLTETVWSVIREKNFLEEDDQSRIVLIARAFQKVKDQN